MMTIHNITMKQEVMPDMQTSQLVQPQSKRIEHTDNGQTQCLPQLVRHQSSKTTDFKKVLTLTQQTLQRMLLKFFRLVQHQKNGTGTYNIK